MTIAVMGDSFVVFVRESREQSEQAGDAAGRITIEKDTNGADLSIDDFKRIEN
jgi:hypothetical protein